jgi:hypothetical protein
VFACGGYYKTVTTSCHGIVAEGVDRKTGEGSKTFHHMPLIFFSFFINMCINFLHNNKIIAFLIFVLKDVLIQSLIPLKDPERPA